MVNFSSIETASQHQPIGQLAPSASMRVLFIGANPFGNHSLDLEEEVRSLERELEAVQHRASISFASRLAVRPDDIVRYVRKMVPNILHFGGHSSDEGIAVRADDGGHLTISGLGLQQFLRGRGVDLVVLNSCESGEVVDTIASSVKVCIGTTAPVSDRAALKFTGSFYQSLGNGHSVKDALRDAVDCLALYGFPNVFFATGAVDTKFVD